MPLGYEAAVTVVHLMMGSLVRPWSWDEWQDLEYGFARRVMLAKPVIHDVAKYQAGEGT